MLLFKFEFMHAILSLVLRLQLFLNVHKKFDIACT